MSNFDYLLVLKEYRTELNHILSKHFQHQNVLWGYDSFEKELYLVIDNKDYVFSFPFFNELKNVDLAVDYNVFIAKIFGEKYITYVKNELKSQIKELNLDNANNQKELYFLEQVDKKLSDKFDCIVKHSELSVKL